MGHFAIWSSNQTQDRVEVQRQAWLGAAAGVQVPAGAVPADCLVILSVDPPGDRAAVLVPDASAGAAKNRIPLGAGLHLAGHGDLLEVGGRRFWVELRPVAEQSLFDPEVHGADLFCAATRARLNPGDPIVTCPGNQGATCGLVYSLVAFEAARTCHGCGASHDSKPWAPPEEPGESSVAELLASAGEGEDA